MFAVKVKTLNSILAFALAALVAGCGRDPEVAKRDHLERGNRFLQEKQYQNAIVEYRNAVQLDPRFGEARHQLAEAYLLTGDAKNAHAEYVRAADLLPDDFAVQMKAGTLRLMAAQFEDAKTIADKVLAKDPKSAQALILRANALAGLKDAQTAIDELEDAIQVDPSQSDLYVNLGQLQARTGKQAEAEAALKQAVAIAPRTPGVHTALGQFYWMTNRRPQAETSFLEAVKLDADNELAHRALAAFYMGAGRAPEAEKHLQAVARVSLDPNARLALADYYLVAKRGPEGVKILERVSQEPGFAVVAQTRIASFDYTAGRHAEAHKRLDELLAKEPTNPTALLVKARFLASENKADDALTRVKAAVQANPRSAQALYLMGQLYTAKLDYTNATKAFTDVLQVNPRAAAAELQLSRVRLAAGDAPAALHHAEQATRTAPNVPATHVALVNALLATGELTRAEAELKPLFGKFAKDAQIATLMGRFFVLKQDYAAARTVLQRAFESDPASIDTLSALVAVDIAQRKPADARQRVERQLAKAPKQISLLLLSARTYALTGETAKAEAALRQTIQIDPSRIEAYSMLGQMLSVQGRVKEGMAEFEKLLKQQPDSVPANTMLAMLLQREGRQPDAEARYQRALKADPAGAAVAANNLAWIYADAGRNLDEALQLAQMAKERMPEQSEVSDTLGWVYYRKQLPALAVPLLKQVADKEPKNALYRYHLGMALLATGDAEKGKEHLRQALALSPTFAGASEARKMLAAAS